MTAVFLDESPADLAERDLGLHAGEDGGEEILVPVGRGLQRGKGGADGRLRPRGLAPLERVAPRRLRLLVDLQDLELDPLAGLLVLVHADDDAVAFLDFA